MRCGGQPNATKSAEVKHSPIYHEGGPTTEGTPADGAESSCGGVLSAQQKSANGSGINAATQRTPSVDGSAQVSDQAEVNNKVQDKEKTIPVQEKASASP